ncbi:N-glycosylation protein-domain-containing protein [Daldinia eschscholtzii]|nr:N-glycosylation protein-domain-containing protein [Daldinia eschscholtzii]
MANPRLRSPSSSTNATDAADKPPASTSATATATAPAPAPVVAVSLLQPRVAVALGIPKRWHHTLSACRLLSIVPPILWGLRYALRFLLADLLRLSERDHGHDVSLSSLRLTETALAVIWCYASAYLAFFFTDCLMSRWLINYTPQATVVRLFTISCAFAYLTSWIVYLAGGSQDPGLLLPAWIGIATILTLCYHFTQRKIKIRKETFASISVFSIASFISMVALLLHSHSTRAGYQNVPIVALTKRACHIGAYIIFRIVGLTGDLDGL